MHYGLHHAGGLLIFSTPPAYLIHAQRHEVVVDDLQQLPNIHLLKQEIRTLCQGMPKEGRVWLKQQSSRASISQRHLETRSVHLVIWGLSVIDKQALTGHLNL